MQTDLPQRLKQKLEERESDGALRKLKHFTGLIDFSSNDYLGFSQHPFIQQHISDKLSEWGQTGSTGSRLLTGNHPAFEQLEHKIASFHDSESALFFGSGYEANSGLIPTVAGRGDVILYDELCHASLREGIRLSFASSFSFAHNNLDALESLLKKQSSNVFIVSESVFSMDGDSCPLPELVDLGEKYQARLIIDEAHSTGVIGTNGEGLAQKKGLHNKIFARIHTYGKAMGVQGAAILGSEDLKTYLVNYCRPFVYTTAPSLALVAGVDAAYTLLQSNDVAIEKLQQIIQYANQIQLGDSPEISSIRIVTIPGNEEVSKAASLVIESGFQVLPVKAPTVSAGYERLRICLHAYNTFDELDSLNRVLNNIIS